MYIYIFTDQLELLITTVKNTSQTLFVCCDFNIDLQNIIIIIRVLNIM